MSRPDVPFLRSQDKRNCGATLPDGTRCERAPEANALRLCIDHAAERASEMLPVASADVERAAIAAPRLMVWTARISSRDPDRLDVTRKSGGPIGSCFAPSAGLLAAGKSSRVTWDEYRDRYLAEMRERYRARRDAWESVRNRPRVVLCCYCVDPDACHRSLLAGYFCKLGADVRGEVGLDVAYDAILAAAASDKLTPRVVVDACDAAGAELCVVWTVLHRRGVVGMSYDSAKDRGLLAAVRALRSERSAIVNEPRRVGA
jgi:hypothetical protein